MDKKANDIKINDLPKLLREVFPYSLIVTSLFFVFIPSICYLHAFSGITKPINLLMLYIATNFLVFLFIVSTPLVALGFLGLFITGRLTKKLASSAILIVTTTALFLPFSLIEFKIRMIGLRTATVRFQPLTDALDKYIKENEKPPKKLSDLSPRYIDKIPTSGMPAFDFKPALDSYRVKDSEVEYCQLSLLCKAFFVGTITYRPKPYRSLGYNSFGMKIGEWTFF